MSDLVALNKNEEFDLSRKSYTKSIFAQRFLDSKAKTDGLFVPQGFVRRNFNYQAVSAIKPEEKEAHEDLAKEEAKHKEMFENAIGNSVEPFLKIKSIFPFDFFPNELVVDMVKVTIMKKEFFFSGSSEAVYIKDIANVVIETGPFLSTLKIIDVSYNTEKHNIQYLKRSDAFKARILIEGLVTAVKRGIDLCKLDRNEVIPYINRLTGITSIPAP